MTNPLANTKVSVVIPVYNTELYVADAITSVLNQSHKNLEVIIVDDCSTDASNSICHSFKDQRILIVRHKVNKGLAATRNTGIYHSKGDFIAFLDSDDMWLPHKIEKHILFMLKNPNVGLSFCSSRFIDFSGRPLFQYQKPDFSRLTSASFLKSNSVGNGSTPVVRKCALDQICYVVTMGSEYRHCWFDEDLRRAEDLECWLRILETTEWTIEGINDPMTLYRINPLSLSSDLEQQLLAWMDMIEKVRKYAPGLIRDTYAIALAHQYRYLARLAIRQGDPSSSLSYLMLSMGQYPAIILYRPFKFFLHFTSSLSAVSALRFCSYFSRLLLRDRRRK